MQPEGDKKDKDKEKAPQEEEKAKKKEKPKMKQSLFLAFVRFHELPLCLIYDQLF